MVSQVEQATEYAELVRESQTEEELNDLQHHFLLFYSDEISGAQQQQVLLTFLTRN